MSDHQPSTPGPAGAATSTVSSVISSGGNSSPIQCTAGNCSNGGSQVPVVTATAAATSQQQQQQVRVSLHKFYAFLYRVFTLFVN